MQIAVFPAFSWTTAAGTRPQLALEEGESTCFYHPDKRAVVPCDTCGRFLCALCDIELHGKHLCPACIAPGKAESGIGYLERGRPRYDQMVWSMLILPLPFCGMAAPLTATAALVLAIWKWGAPGSLVARTRLRLGVGMATAVVELAFSAWLWSRVFK